MDMRYHTIEKLAMDEGDFTEIDLPCGYLPKALRYVRTGHRFIGLDLPATIAEVEPAINALLDEKQKTMVKFAGVDATNYESLKSAISDVGVKGSSLVVFPKEDITEDIRKAMEFLAKHGLKAERMIVAEHQPKKTGKISAAVLRK